MDWTKWHELYGERWALKMRLALVQRQTKKALSAAPSGEVKVVSICAGDGRDLAGAMRNHRRANDVSAVLVEIEEDLVEIGRDRFEQIGATSRVDFRVADATNPSSYDGAGSANIVMACGMLGLVTHETTEDLVQAIRALIRPEGFLIWTRSLALRGGQEQASKFRNLLSDNGFSETSYSVTTRPLFRRGPESHVRFIIATHQYHGETQVLSRERLFEITSDLSSEST